MSGFKQKLSRLPSPSRSWAGAAAPAVVDGALGAGPPDPPNLVAGVAEAPRASLDELRRRIANILGSASAPPRRADPSADELPFARVETPAGVLYSRRIQCGAGARVGRAPLHGACLADAGMLALLALDPTLATCDPKRALFVDTETTGLSGGTGTVPFLIGVSWHDEGTGQWVLEQFLLRELGHEGPMLDRFAERLADASMIVTYNGKAFDLPLLRTRFVMNRRPLPVEPPHLDLLHVARRVHRTRLKQRTLTAIEERVLGQTRVGDVAGADVVAVYAHYLRTGDASALLGVIEHNERDVLSMVALVGLYGEPLGSLDPEDLAGAAHTVRRAGELSLAAELADHAVSRGGGARARRARGDIAKARGDRALALADFEAFFQAEPAASEDEGEGDALSKEGAAVRLELAKLYEHYVKSPARALALVDEGTSETDERAHRRRARLVRKLAEPVPVERAVERRARPSKRGARWRSA